MSTKNQKVTVIDSVMGSGKTSLAIQMINDNPDSNFIYITPYVDETYRVQGACPDHNVAVPERKGHSNKSDDDS